MPAQQIRDEPVPWAVPVVTATMRENHEAERERGNSKAPFEDRAVARHRDFALRHHRCRSRRENIHDTPPCRSAERTEVPATSMIRIYNAAGVRKP
ncbi:hypothetical protein BOX37_13900 [Nocardia mangyaensis]|uniref:Uncharacterized protein n=1 Tax=Nocardia mangyaensis TaxID=2213200 RepID=A0A1J0VS45_9NOCA|nr:hypothetical protein BOX37_13900 [Nocardia mangyaensis]